MLQTAGNLQKINSLLELAAIRLSVIITKSASEPKCVQQYEISVFTEHFVI